MKVTGAEIKQFWNDPDDRWTDHDDSEVYFDDVSELSDSIKYETARLGGFLDTKTNRLVTFTSAFKTWKAQQTHETFVVSVPKESLDEVKSYLKAKGVKIA